MTDKTMTLFDLEREIRLAGDADNPAFTRWADVLRSHITRHLSQPAERGEPVAWAWKSDGMTGWALGHCKPTPDNTHKFHERNTIVRPLVFGDTTTPPAAGVPDGWKLVAVNEHFGDMMYWVERAVTNGHAPDIDESWDAFSWREIPAAPSPAIDVAAVRDAKRLQRLIDLCGYVEDGSNVTVKLSQDDATCEWLVHAGKRWWHGSSPRAAIDATDSPG